MKAQIVSHARAWIGTPYLHQASVKGAGCDCLGLIRGLWRERFGTEPEAVPRYTPDWSEPQGDEVLWRAALRHMRDVTDEPFATGQILLFRMRQGAVAKHLGVFANDTAVPTFIHAYAGHGVVESPLSAPWKSKIAARFVFRKE
jgi:NlpC/P60 family putative phage cell wall peptidase